jgi:7,8-dihydropterin-6-yl-methyl-4-(beta-D-ribofuranosyl)aminobenzene 5'-phosphate synthase
MRITRRTLLGAAAAAPLAGAVRAAALSVPTVDRLTLTILADGTVSNFAQPVEVPGMRLAPPPRSLDYRRTLRAEFGYSVLAEAVQGERRIPILVDFGYTPEALANNMALLSVDPASFAAMVLSHGHYDHFGGMPAVLGKVARGTPLFVGGEEAFCERLRGTTAGAPSFGRIDRPALAAAGIDVRVGGEPQRVAGAGFTTGRIPFRSAEHPKVPSAMVPGEGCRRALLDPDRRGAELFGDDAVHELGTAFNLAGKGLVVIGSCSHRGIVNTVLRARAVSGVDKLFAVAGGFHLVPPQAPADALATLAMLRALDPQYLFPGHCSGEAFIAPALAELPGRVFRTVVGSRIELG